VACRTRQGGDKTAGQSPSGTVQAGGKVAIAVYAVSTRQSISSSSIAATIIENEEGS